MVDDLPKWADRIMCELWLKNRGSMELDSGNADAYYAAIAIFEFGQLDKEDAKLRNGSRIQTRLVTHVTEAFVSFSEADTWPWAILITFCKEAEVGHLNQPAPPTSCWYKTSWKWAVFQILKWVSACSSSWIDLCWQGRTPSKFQPNRTTKNISRFWLVRIFDGGILEQSAQLDWAFEKSNGAYRRLKELRFSSTLVISPVFPFWKLSFFSFLLPFINLCPSHCSAESTRKRRKLVTVVSSAAIANERLTHISFHHWASLIKLEISRLSAERLSTSCQIEIINKNGAEFSEPVSERGKG